MDLLALREDISKLSVLWKYNELTPFSACPRIEISAFTLTEVGVAHCVFHHRPCFSFKFSYGSHPWLERVYTDRDLPCVKKLQKQDVFYSTGVNWMVRGHFHSRQIFFLMVFKCIFFLNDSKNKMHFSQHLLLRISRRFTGWNVLNLAVSLYREYIPACPIHFLSLQWEGRPWVLSNP